MKKTATISTETVDDYLSELPSDVKAMLQKVRRAIKSAAPKAEEVISYNIPTYKFKGPLVHFAAFKDHCSFVVITPSIMQIFGDEFRRFKNSGRTIHFSPENPLPATLIKKIVKVRVQENEQREGLKEALKTGKAKKKSRI